MSKQCGISVCFHGAYRDKAAAVRKAKQRGGSVLKRRMRGGVRWVVVTQK